jgi:hypothetical protein
MRLPPVVESLFRAIYKQLAAPGDSSTPTGLGLVSAAELLTVFEQTPSIQSLIIAQLCKQGDAGHERYERCILRLRELAEGSGDAAVLTYGEMLLLLIPDADQGSGRQEWRLLQNKGLYFDDTCAMLPLQLTGEVDTSYDAGISGACVHCERSVTKEIRRLRREKAALMSRLQHVLRGVDRRVECVEAHYADRIQSMEVQLSHHKAQLRSETRRVSELEHRILEGDAAHASVSAQQTSSIQMLTEQVQSLRSELAQVHESSVQKSYYVQMSAVNVALEEETAVLRQELVKLKVSNIAHVVCLSALVMK